MARSIRITDRNAIFAQAWKRAWKEQTERGENHASATDLYRTVRCVLVEMLQGSKPGSCFDAWGARLRATGFTLMDCRSWLRRQVETRKLAMYLPRQGVISGARFRPIGTPLTKAEQKAVNTTPEERRRQRHISHYKGADGRPLCMANMPKQSHSWRSRAGFRNRPYFTSEDYPNPTCKRCAKLKQPMCEAPKVQEPVETHEVEFSVNVAHDIPRVATSLGLTIDPNFSSTNGGVTKALRFTGPRSRIVRLARSYGYPGQNPDLVPLTGIDALLNS